LQIQSLEDGTTVSAVIPCSPLLRTPGEVA
jgi:hypothetical protein